MKPIQLILIAVALTAAIGAGFVMMTLNDQPQTVIQAAAPVPQIKLKKVLVAGQNIPMGSALGTERLIWQEWPEDGVHEGFILESDKPEGLQEYAPTIARSTFFAGEPIREEKIVRSDSGYLSAILPAGKRAVAVRVDAKTSAGGFILPNDHVDVIMSFRNEDDEWITDTILQNIRVLAIDQVIEEQEGDKAKVGDTVTLELNSEQVEIITEAAQISNNKLTLALRSVEDTQVVAGKKRGRRGNVRLIRFGKASEIKTKN
ncbi:MAG: Flp pilus assembly protein CpaB [Pseudomonadota bacterium]